MIGTILVCMAVAGLAAVAAGAAGAAPSLAGPGAIRITDRLVRHVHVRVDKSVQIDKQPTSLSRAGNLDFFRSTLQTRTARPVTIGHSDITCVDTGTGSENCSGTYFLPKGKIMVAGVIASHLFYELAVVGGTGLYDNVRGSLTVTYLSGAPVRELLLFRLTV
jgi:hypothetical protein